jgi:hypothetical protein
MAAMSPLVAGAPDATEIPTHSGSAIMNTIKPDLRSAATGALRSKLLTDDLLIETMGAVFRHAMAMWP